MFSKGDRVRIVRPPKCSAKLDTQQIKRLFGLVCEVEFLVDMDKNIYYEPLFSLVGRYRDGEEFQIYMPESWLQPLVSNATCPLCGWPGEIGFNLVICSNHSCQNGRGYGVRDEVSL